MIDANMLQTTTGNVITGNLPLLAAEGSALFERTANFSTSLENALNVDVKENPTHTLKRAAKGIGVAAALGAELSVGNEVPVIALGIGASRLVDGMQPTGNTVIDALIGGSLVAGAVYPFSFYQQMLYGRIAQSAIKDYPTTMNTVSSLRNSKAEKDPNQNENGHSSDGNIALAVGTTLALVAHKTKNPNSTTEQETQVIKRGAKIIAGFWASVLGVATVVTTGADKIENSPVLQAVSGVKNPQILVPIAGGAYLLKEWYDLLRSKNVKPNQVSKSENTPVDLALTPVD